MNMSKPPWITSEMNNIARDRDILFRNYRRGKKKNELYRRAVEKRKEFNRLVKASRDSFYKEQLEISENDQVKFWKTLGNILGSTSNPKISRIFEYGSDILCDEETSVNKINEFFASIGENIMKGLPNIDYKQLYSANDKLKNEFNLMSVGRFLEIVNELSHTKSSGVDDLNSSFIIDAMQGIPEVFVKVCNESLCSGVFPTLM